MNQPPPGWQPPPGQQPPGWQPGWQQPRQSNVGVIVGLAVAGIAAYMMFNLILGFVVIAVGESLGSGAVAGGAIILVLVAFGGGGGLIAMKKPWSKGLGMGLMIGWALTSIFTVGFCTGLNPVLYEGGI